MAYINLNTTKLIHNYDYLNNLFEINDIEWAIVSKILCGNEIFLKSLLQISNKEICDSRLSNLQAIKKISPKTQTIYIKPPANRLAKEIVEFADVSFNTELGTLKALSEEAVKQKKIHKVVLMVEMGELREGILVNKMVQFYAKISKLRNLKIVGIGTNLNCLNGILPDKKKLQKLNHCRNVIEKKFGEKIPYISGGSSVTIPLIFKDRVPEEINHFRVGETLFFGTDVYNDTVISGMYHDVFTLTSEIIELQEKPKVPFGKAGTNLTGETPQFSNAESHKTSFRAIMDIGLLDIDIDNIKPIFPDVEIIGASSDMLILDLGVNKNGLKAGDSLKFTINYMAVLRAMNSDYVDKKISNKIPASELKILEFKN
ncbi:alanine racemase [Candidatus Kaistella beijingensis]|uniref:alanine racemase n=1 Tax=Candidatus Kaistella beijingensis TaxID=2820270 RepID=UPI001CC47561|nr:alanine racemase [Candidatus Kaistella beijingensis]UBB90386.1 alanine racemase [Candidatus Kaistella beijingensis]